MEIDVTRLMTTTLSSCALVAALATAGSGYAQTREGFDEPGAPPSAAPTYADDSCETGKYGPPVRVESGDVVENGEIVARDPDPNIRTQLERETRPVATTNADAPGNELRI
jgi:hypothetical protein